MKKNDTLFIYKLMFIAALVFSTFGYSQCDVNHTSTTTYDYTVASSEVCAQSFIATCSGNLEYFELIATNPGTISSTTLNIYNGNTITDTPIYTQSYPEITITSTGDPITFNIMEAVPLVMGNQYTFEFTVNNVGFLIELPGTYADGYLWLYGFDSGFDSIFSASIVEDPLSIDSYEFSGKKIYPNPVTTFINISGLTTAENYTIYDVLGTKISNGNISNNETLDVQNLTNGLYFLKFENGSTLKFIKE